MNKKIVISGIVMQGKQQARLQGYPTANFDIQEDLNENDAGLYAGVVTEIGGVSKYNAVRSCVVFISHKGKIAECHIREFNKDIYGQPIVVELQFQLAKSKTTLEKDCLKLKDCTSCHFLKSEDYGYSNWTVEGTSCSCMHPSVSSDEVEEDSWNDPVAWRRFILQASVCPYYLQGNGLYFDCDGEACGGKPREYIESVHIKDGLEKLEAL